MEHASCYTNLHFTPGSKRVDFLDEFQEASVNTSRIHQIAPLVPCQITACCKHAYILLRIVSDHS